MTQDDKKRAVAEAALDLIEPGTVIGIGTGSTANHFIDALAATPGRIEGTVASSEASAARLARHGVPVLALDQVDELTVYVDGADESNEHLQLVKGGGGALTREKIIAAASRRFVCIVDESKKVGVLGRFPLPVEVIPMARSYVGRQLVALGGQPELREDFVTDNGNLILDVHNMDLVDPVTMEQKINDLAGVVCNGLFALRPADVVLMATANGVERF